MTEQQLLTDSSDLRKYRTELPNMADDDLDPFQFRLYAHYKRVCGASNGTCYEGVRTTAEKTKMSAEKVIATRQWLADNGWIELEQGVKGVFQITIIDRWAENFVRYSERSKRQTVRNSEQSTRTPLEIPNSTVRNSEQSPLEIPNERKNYIKKEQSKKEHKRLSPAASLGEQGKSRLSAWMAELNLELEPRQRVPLANRLAQVCGLEAVIDAGDDVKNEQCHRAAITLYRMGIATPADLDDWYADYLADEWTRKNNPHPAPFKVTELVSKKAQGAKQAVPVAKKAQKITIYNQYSGKYEEVTL